MKIQENVLISQLTTMRLGGACRYLAEIENEADIKAAYEFVAKHNISSYILGDGSNVIACDSGFEGLILLNRIRGIEVLDETDDYLILRVASGEELDDLSAYTVERDWYGAEALAEIPGTVGGAVMQNAGAYGQEMSQILLGVDAYDTQTSKSGVAARIDTGEEFVHIPVEDMELSYRHSIFNSDGPNSAKGRYFITAAHLRLHKQEMQGELYGSLQAYLQQQGIVDRQAKTIRDAIIDIRTQKLPNPATTASSGSFFKNITIDEADIEPLRKRFPGIPIFLIGGCWEIASGWLIEQVGLKGQLIDGMRVSDKAALILINESAAGYDDLARARETIVAAVKERFGFTLQQEPEEL